MPDTVKIPWILREGLIVDLVLCIGIPAVFFANGIFSERTLFIVLSLWRYLLCFLILLSFCALGINIWRCVKQRQFIYILSMVFSCISLIIGIFLIFLNSFIAVAAEGNV